MKKVTLFLAAAAIIGVGSAFTTKTAGIGDEYVKLGDTYYPKEQFLEDHPDSYCETLPGTCTYLSTVATPSPTNPSDYTAASGSQQGTGHVLNYIP